MKSIQTKIIFVISSLMLTVTIAFLITSTRRTSVILGDDSEQILRNSADYYANVIDDNFRSTEQSVGTIYNYALKRAETYRAFLVNEEQRNKYTYDISELGKSIAENTRGAMAVYLRYNPDDYGPTDGFWYTINLKDNSWQPSEPTDMSLYDKDDIEHVGWYYIPVETGRPMWMAPYYNANLGVNMISYIIPCFYGEYAVGIIGMDISMDLLKESASEVKVYETGRAFMIEKTGDIIYHEDYPDGMPFSDMSDSDKEYFGRLLDAQKDVPFIYPGHSGEDTKLILKDLKNGMILGIYAPQSEISAPRVQLQMQQLLISGGILLLAVFICLVWVRTIIDPIKKMTAVALSYENGRFDEELTVQGNDEVGILSRALQNMASSLQKQIEIADSANKAKSEFLASMSHEIRTPINAVLGMNEMILRVSKEDEILEYAHNIQNAGRTLLSLINSILDFSKIEDGKMEIIPVSYDTALMINNLVNSVSERAKEKKLKFTLDIDEKLPSMLIGDDMRISQIIMNLLTNAVKYTPRGEVTLTVSDGGRVNDSVVLSVSVKDTGIGIRKEDMGKLFEPFERIEEKRNRAIEGTGLGMAIVTALLDEMDSELHIESVYGQGSTFSFNIMQQIDDPAPIGNYSERVKESYHRSAREVLPRITGANVLVVDDYSMNLRVASSLLKLYGITADMASSGKDAIIAVSRKKYHIVFLDHMMPGMDGIDTLREMKDRDLLPNDTAMVILTANAVVGAKDMYINAGFDDYLSKPIELKELGDMLLKYIPGDLVSYDEDMSGQLTPPTEEDPSAVKTVILDFPPKRKDSGDTEGGNSLEGMLMAKAGVSFEEGLKYCGGQKELYIEVLTDYCASCEQKSKELSSALDASDLDSYRIAVHALKSVSKTIGAGEVSEKAKQLEDAAKSGDINFIQRHHTSFLELYGKTAKAIHSVLEEK